MSDEKKVISAEKKAEMQDIDLDDLSEVTGGSIKDVSYTETKPISKKTQEKI